MPGRKIQWEEKLSARGRGGAFPRRLCFATTGAISTKGEVFACLVGLSSSPHRATERRPLRNGSTGSHSDRLMTRNEDPVVAVVWHSFSSSLQIGPTNLPPPLLLNQTPAYRPPLCLGCGPGGISPSSLKVKFSGRGGEKGQFLVLDRTFLGKKPREKPILLCSSFPLS